MIDWILKVAAAFVLAALYLNRHVIIRKIDDSNFIARREDTRWPSIVPNNEDN